MNHLQSRTLKYVLLPEIVPRILRLFKGGFSQIAYLLAVIYQAMRLLPPGHAYLNPQNVGRYGLRHVIAEAANHLVISKKNIDQVVIFVVLLVGIVVLFTQFILLVFSVVAQPALALAADSGLLGGVDIFLTSSQYNAGPAQDLAFMMMDRVFGLQNVFDSCVANPDVPCLDLQGNPLPDAYAIYPTAFHRALHTLLAFYSRGMFFVGVIVILYFLTAIVGETATTGSPMGERYNKTWIPVRLIFFFALLVPLNTGGPNAGLNGAQMITFWSAKFGSNFASNTWGFFNERLTTTYAGDVQKLVATPNVPELSSLLKTVFLAKTCKIAEEWAYTHVDEGDNMPDGIQGYIVREKQILGDTVSESNPNPDALQFLTADYQAALDHANNGNIFIRFGAEDPEKYADNRANVKPLCGEILIKTVHANETLEQNMDGIQAVYYQIIQEMWGTDGEMTQRAACVVRRTYQKAADPDCPAALDHAFAQNRLEYYQTRLEEKVTEFIDEKIEAGVWDVPEELSKKGWGGAAIWYNRIAELNGAVTSAVLNLPQRSKYPFVMEVILEHATQQNEDVDPDTVFDPALGQSQGVKYERFGDQNIVPPMLAAYNFWQEDDYLQSSQQQKTGNIIIDAINAVLGTSGMFDMRANADIHPLAQLSALGRGMMEAAIRNFAIGAIGGPLSKLLPDSAGKAGSAISSFLSSIAFSTIAIAFILYYILPFMPFLYFMVAVGGWVKSIFEAITAMPLWALAHIARVDGEGLPGPAASNGYFLIFEIFLRPVLIVVGLLASVSIFAAMVEVLNEVFDLVIANLAGHNSEDPTGDDLTEFMRGPVDTFFFTAIYAIFCYMIGLSCFKLIDLIPDNILRWSNVTAATFQESDKNAPGELLQRSYSGVLITTNQVKGGALAALIG